MRRNSARPHLPKRSRRIHGERGIVLMVMLSLLALFTVMAVTFVVASGQFRRGAAIAAKAEQTSDPFEVLMQQALMQVVRGSEHPQSAIGPHSLLEDMYGQSDSVTGCVWYQPKGDPNDQSEEMQDYILRDWRSNYQASPDSFLIKFVAYGFGYDRLPGTAMSDDDGNGVIDDNSELTFFSKKGDDGYLGMTRAHPLTQSVPEPGKPISEWTNKPTEPLPFVDNVDNYYAGRVITFMTGEAAGQSCYIVRSKIFQAEQGSYYTVLMITPPANGKLPGIAYDTPYSKEFDRFVINGRPFNGRGFGATPYTFNASLGLPNGLKQSTVKHVTFTNGTVASYPPDFNEASLSDVASAVIIPNPSLRRLDHLYWSPSEASGGSSVVMNDKGVPLAYTPNPIDVGMRDYLNRYAPFVEADEDYDAPDMQNMLLAYRQWNSRTRHFETIAPSLHRPDLINYFVRGSLTPPVRGEQTVADVYKRQWYHLPPAIRRRVMLRPDPVDHYDYTQEGTLDPKKSDGWTPGEPFNDFNLNGVCDLALGEWDTLQGHDLNGNNVYDIGDRPFINPNFNAITGPWDVDNDGDGSPDSVLVDLGMPVITASDGKLVKPMFAVMVLDLDGRINANAHGTPAHYGTVTLEELNSIQHTIIDPTGIVSSTGVYQSGGSPLSSLQFKDPSNDPKIGPVQPHVKNTTEDRFFIGGYGYASTQPAVSLTSKAGYGVTRDPIISSGLFPLSTDTTAAHWATAYQEDYPGRNYGQDFRTGKVTTTGIQPTRLQPAFGQGYSPADVSLAPALWGDRRDLPSFVNVRGGVTWLEPVRRANSYRELLEGHFRTITRTTSIAPPPTPTPGRYGEYFLTRSEKDYRPGFGVVPRAGRTRTSFETDTENNDLSSQYDDTAADPSNRKVNRYVHDDNMPASPSGDGDLYGNSSRDAFGYLNRGDYGTPGDFQSGGALGLDLRGQPIAVGMGGKYDTIDEPTEINLNRRYFATFRAGNGSTTPSMDVDDPESIPEKQGKLAYIDAPFTPAEMERLLRLREPNSAGLSNRLVSMFDEDWYIANLLTTESWDLPCPHVAPTPELAGALRDLSLPVGNPTIGDLLRARFYLAHGFRPNNPSDPNDDTPRCDVIRSASLATIAMRSYAYKSGTPDSIELADNRSRLISPDIALGLRMDVNAPFGNGIDDNDNGIVDEPGEWPESLRTSPSQSNLPPNVLNFDGNRDGNVQPTPPHLQDPTTRSYQREFENPRQQFAKELYCLMMLLVDQNYVMPLPQILTSDPDDQSNVTTAIERVANVNPMKPIADQPRVHFDDTLFSLLKGNDTDDPTINDDTDIDVLKAKRWLTAQRLAQWAINVADFRDRDSIMSPFEFDVDPFNDNDLADPQSPTDADAFNISGNIGIYSTWDVDGDLTTDEHQKMHYSGSGTNGENGNWFRGVVWGCEYPDLLLMETLAFHDRRTANTMYEVETSGGTTTGTDKFCRLNSGGAIIAADPDDPMKKYDTTWDQVRVPEGSAFIELYATGNPNLVSSHLTTSYTDSYGNSKPCLHSMLPQELYNPQGNLLLSKMTPTQVNGSPAIPYPVWRLAITQGRVRHDEPGALTPLPQNDVAMRLTQTSPGTCSLDPADPGFSILPWVNGAATTTEAVIIERVVTFCTSTDVSKSAATAGLNVTQTLGQLTTTAAIDVFYAENVSNTSLSLQLMPGQYAVVGPHRRNASSDSNEALFGQVTTIGRTATEGLSLTTNSGKKEVVVNSTDTQPPGVLSLANDTFIATSPNGTIEYPMYNLSTTMYLPNLPLWSTVTGTPGLDRLINTNANNSHSPTAPNYDQIKAPLSIGCALRIDKTDKLYDSRIGLNISEPTTTERGLDTTDPSPPTDPYQQQAKGGGAVTLKRAVHTDSWEESLKRSDTFDSPNNKQIYDDIPWDGYYDVAGGDEVVNNPQLPQLADSTTLRYKSVFLQRLADPTKPWHAQTNPYLTMDWMPFDLTVFNGEPWWVAPRDSGGMMTNDRQDQLDAFTAMINNDDPATTGTDPEDPFEDPEMDRAKLPPEPSDLTTYDTHVRFGSRQRGAPRRPFRGNFSNFNLWTQPNWLDNTFSGSTLPPLTRPINSNNDEKTTYKLGDPDEDFWCKWQDPLQHTLGYLNEPYHYRMSYLPANPNPRTRIVTKPMSRPAPRNTRYSAPDDASTNFVALDKGWLMAIDLGGSYRYLGDTNDPEQVADLRPSERRYLGDPWRPFNWLTWNNRPFSGAMELMLVPAVGPSRLLHEYDMRRTKLPGTNANAGTPPGTVATNDFAPWEPTRSAIHYLPPISMEGEPGYLVRPPFGHLLNFFESSTAAGFGQTPKSWSWAQTSDDPPVAKNPQLYSAGNFYRIFEFLTVPSRFSGTRQVARNELFNNAGAGYSDVRFSGNEHPGWPFTAPFNMISAYREPGRVNLNTMPIMPQRQFGNPTDIPEPNLDQGAAVWRAVTNEFHPKARWMTLPSGSKTSLMSRRYNRTFWGPKYNQADNPSPWNGNDQAGAPINSVTGQAPRLNTNRGLTPGLNNTTPGATDYPWNPSQDSAENFHNLFASMHSDNPNHDPRGPNGRIGSENGNTNPGSNVFLPKPPYWISQEWPQLNNSPTELDDTIWWPLDKRCDPQRPSLFNNPFRAFSEDFSAVPPPVGYSSGTGETPLESYLSSASLVTDADKNIGGNVTYDPYPVPFLSIDSTLLRRRDTLWSPWDMRNMRLWPQAKNSFTGDAESPEAAKASIRVSDAQLDPAFDPLFVLNFPRPFASSRNAAQVFSGYSINMLYDTPGVAVNAVDGADPNSNYYLSRTTDYRNTDRNPFFRYQLYSKLSNIATTRSNVYAIWVTLVYFEVERVDMRVPLPSQENATFGGFLRGADLAMPYRYPDGYRLVRELGSETGETVRHKAFAIFDRTIPVGFLRGENLNVDQGFLVRRVLY